MTLTLPTHCWYCLEPLSVEDKRVDEFGFRVHEQCWQKMKTEDEQVRLREPKPPKAS